MCLTSFIRFLPIFDTIINSIFYTFNLPALPTPQDFELKASLAQNQRREKVPSGVALTGCPGSGPATAEVTGSSDRVRATAVMLQGLGGSVGQDLGRDLVVFCAALPPLVLPASSIWFSFAAEVHRCWVFVLFCCFLATQTRVRQAPGPCTFAACSRYCHLTTQYTYRSCPGKKLLFNHGNSRLRCVQGIGEH